MLMTDTLGDALPREIKRVQEKKERWTGYAADMERMSPGSAVGMKLTMRVMQAHIDAGVAALAAGDVVAMITAHEDLKSYSDED
jgi:hypothetical protein